MVRSPAARQPSVRARYMQTFAKHLERLADEDRAAVRAAVPEETWRAIDSAGLLAWLPLEMNLACTRAVASRLGPDRTQQFFRELVLAAIDTPLLRGFVQGVLRVAVPDAGHYLPWLARGFELAPGWALLQIRNLPLESASDSMWIKSVASSLYGLMDLTGLEGTTVVHEVDVKARTVTYASRWTKKSAT